jgi:hypothetical protein
LRAAELSPGSPEIHFHLLRAHARKNLLKKAATERAVFARLNALAEQQRGVTGSQSYGAFVSQMEFLWPCRIRSEHLQAVLRRNEFLLTEQNFLS